MTCASCVRHVEQALAKVNGVVSATVNLATEQASVEFEGHVAAEKLTAAVSDAGYEARVIERERNALDLAADRRLRRETDIRRRAAQLAAGAVLSGVTLLLAYAFGSWHWSPYLQLGAALPVWLWVGWKFHRGALRSARHGAANMDTLVSLGSSVAFVYSALALFLLPGRQTFFEVAALIVTLISVGKLLEVVARGRAGAAIEALAGLQPRSAHLLARAARPDDWKQATPVDVPVDRIHVGDVVLIRPGERVPTDGVVIDGEGAVDESMLTGESMPVLKTPGSVAVGATVNGNAALVLRATRVGSATILAHILAIVERAQTEKAPVQRLADRVSAIFVPVDPAHRRGNLRGLGAHRTHPRHVDGPRGGGPGCRLPVRTRAGDARGRHGGHRARRRAGAAHPRWRVARAHSCPANDRLRQDRHLDTGHAAGR